MNNENTKNTEQTISVYSAVREMQRLTLAGGEFSFSFYKYDRSRHTGGDLARISRARLRPKAASSKVENSDYKLYFTDMDNGRSHVCWQMLIVEFNGLKCTLD